MPLFYATLSQVVLVPLLPAAVRRDRLYSSDRSRCGGLSKDESDDHEFDHSRVTPGTQPHRRRPCKAVSLVGSLGVSDLAYPILLIILQIGLQGVSIYGTNAFSLPFRPPGSTSKCVPPTVHRLHNAHDDSSVHCHRHRDHGLDDNCLPVEAGSARYAIM